MTTDGQAYPIIDLLREAIDKEITYEHAYTYMTAQQL